MFQCFCAPLEGLRSLAFGASPEQPDAAIDNREVPEIYQARYSRRCHSNLTAEEVLPLALQKAIAAESPHKSQVNEERLFIRSSNKFPNHFLHSTLQSQGLGRAVYYFEENEDGVVEKVFTCWSLSETLEGPPNHCHGGCIAALIDDAFGAFTNTHLRSQGRSGEAVTAFLHVDYKAPTPLPGSVVCVVTLDRMEGRKIFAKNLMILKRCCFSTPGENACFKEGRHNRDCHRGKRIVCRA
eukprot:TRINITY_DN31989_c0_g1_i2.p1 TRINITY_DN31989_c0_g1~~TRINITY_DN31989_c0_g1_i2.p1  ORF type:complete len:240 (+),score=36.34 TRINITY_DN31989_c0_g1_i2:59-778(+)